MFKETAVKLPFPMHNVLEYALQKELSFRNNQKYIKLDMYFLQ